jgi:polyisoprenoid-binding protein YceI
LKHPRRWLLGGLAAVVLVLVGGYVLVALQGDDAPPPPGLSPAQADGGAAPAGQFKVVASPATFAGYRVDEDYLGVGVHTAVGRTPLVHGTLTLDGSKVTGATLVADLTQLRSDRSRRDEALQTRGIETARYPRASFQLDRPFAISRRPQQTTGRLALHGHKEPVPVTVRGQRLSGGELELAGTAQVRFADFAIQPPSVAGLVKVQDHGVLEFRLRLEPLR